MNMAVGNVTAPPAPRRLEEMALPIVMMRDILLKTMFRSNLDVVTEITRGRPLGRASNTVGRPAGSVCEVSRPAGL